ncbi:Peptidase C19 ubiquitin carboxyl-terminal hydrolase [Trinorchestia longiramus]|nr:Peptidase C19 ubiquitin carboxyl-terminal hydrolase [Trinorchestia longiramus]
MSFRITCSHLYTLDPGINDAFILQKYQEGQCDECECPTSVQDEPLWLCLYSGCQELLCGGNGTDGHAAEHNNSEPSHSLVMCLSNSRVWCYLCNMEVTDAVRRQLQLRTGREDNPADPDDCEEAGVMSAKFEPIELNEVNLDEYEPDCSFEDSESLIATKPRGVVGLRNLGLTCYMNAALQVLGLSPGIASFFMNCHGPLSGIRMESALALVYRDLIRDMWHHDKPSYIVPAQLYHSFKQVCSVVPEQVCSVVPEQVCSVVPEQVCSVVPEQVCSVVPEQLYPMFRTFSQQDSQEFLRYFLDELHSELRQPLLVPPPELESDESGEESDSDSELRSANGGSCSSLGELRCESPLRTLPEPCDGPEDSEENKYETCDSGVSENETDASSSPLFGGRKRRLRSFKQSSAGRDDVKSGEEGESATDEQIMRPSTRIPLSSTQSLISPLPWTPQSPPHSAVSSPRHSSPPSPHTVPSPGGRTLSSKTSGLGSYSTSLASPESYAGSILQNSRRRYGKNSKGHRSKKISQQPYSSSIVSDLFDGQLISSVQCLTCNSVSARRETFQDLSLPIPSGDQSMPAEQDHGTDGWVWWMVQWLMSWVWGFSVSLNHCLSAFFSADELKGDNMYSCEKCGKLRNGLKFSKVVKLPEVLVVHLKRFRHDYMFSSKISQHVAFPLTDLNLQPYFHRDCVSEVCQYSLYGVICHHGSVVGGHYTSLAQHPKTGIWYEFDDEAVSYVTPEYVQRSQAYVLFYKKNNPEAEKIRNRASALMRSHSLNQCLVKFYISKQWFNKFQSFGECGPIDNSDFLCPHGGVQPRKVDCVGHYVKTINESLWEFLKQKFGGAPPCTRLYTCPICTSQFNALVTRQRIELNTFKVLNSQSLRVFGVSMLWFSQWEKFVLDRCQIPPPAIDNTSVIKQYQQRHPATLLYRSNSDYVSITEECWTYFQHVYGGGPAFCLQQVSEMNLSSQQQDQSYSGQSASAHMLTEPARVHVKPTSSKRTLAAEDAQSCERSVASVPSAAQDHQAARTSPASGDVHMTEASSPSCSAAANVSTRPALVEHQDHDQDEESEDEPMETIDAATLGCEQRDDTTTMSSHESNVSQLRENKKEPQQALPVDHSLSDSTTSLTESDFVTSSCTTCASDVTSVLPCRAPLYIVPSIRETQSLESELGDFSQSDVEATSLLSASDVSVEVPSSDVKESSDTVATTASNKIEPKESSRKTSNKRKHRGFSKKSKQPANSATVVCAPGVHR